LTAERVLALADAYRLLFGRWPLRNDGPVGNTGEEWSKIDYALRHGTRGLKGGSSLSQLLRSSGRIDGCRTPRR
jgi:hypothetical protein